MRAKLFRNVPFARSGSQTYHADEIGVDGAGLIAVDRPPAAVAASAASFEGVPITMDHPAVLLDADGVEHEAVGLVSSVRFDDGRLRGDLLIWCEDAIRAVADGVRELSAGYTAEYQRDGEGYRQSGIKGNHIALVQRGRAGRAVRIGG